MFGLSEVSLENSSKTKNINYKQSLCQKQV